MSPVKKYGTTSEEDEILALGQCREIVSEILNFGVNQNQVLAIIKLLSLELENRETMLQIVEAVENSIENNRKLTIEI